MHDDLVKSATSLLLAEADLGADDMSFVPYQSSFLIVRIITFPDLYVVPRIGTFSIYDKTRKLLIGKMKSGKVYKASFGRRAPKI